MKQIQVSAPGKLILIGEHSAVYGKPAVIIAVDKRCYATISSRKDKKIKIVSKNFKKKITTDIEKVIAKFNKAQDDWRRFDRGNDFEILKSITKEPLDYPQIVIGQFLEYYKLNSPDGFDLVIDSEIPVGSGMGSSAAVAVSIIGALFLFNNKKFNKKIMNEIAFLAEQKNHGKPSGGDNSTSCFGGVLYFKKGEGVKPLGIKLGSDLTKNLYVVNTGTPVESTGGMIGLVSLLHQKKPKFVEDIFADQEKLTLEILDALNNESEEDLMRIIKAAERNLEKIGVVSTKAQALIKEINGSGGAAKICGAGGRKNKSGIILIYHKDFQDLKSILKIYNIKAEQIELGTEGLIRETKN